MLDTNTCIYAQKRAAGFKPKISLGDCGISVVVLGELEWGVRQSARVKENLAALNDLLRAVPVVGLEADVARHYGQLRTHLNSIGQIIGPNDLWIAAHALALELPLITHNLSEFQRVPGLLLDTWMNPAPTG